MAHLPPLRALSLLLALTACGAANTTFAPSPDGGDDAAVTGDATPTGDAATPGDASANDASTPRDASAGDVSTPRDAVTDTGPVDVGACMAMSLASRTGSEVAMGDTSTSTDDESGSCGGEGSPEMHFSWTAPAAGTYTFDTTGTDFDTVLYVRDGACLGAELDCNDDNDDGLQSTVVVSLRAGQTVVIVVDGYDEKESGPFVLNITAGGAVTDGGRPDVTKPDADPPPDGDFDAGPFDGDLPPDDGSFDGGTPVDVGPFDAGGPDV